MKRSFVQIVSSVLVVALLLTAFGCYGSFNLTTKVYKFNGRLGDQWVNELGFIVMATVQVYTVSALIDGLILNSIEFWTGKNPVVVNNDGIQTINLSNGQLVLNSANEVYELKQIIEGRERIVRVESKNGETIARDGAGTVLARSLSSTDGGVLIYDSTGKLVSSLTRMQVESMVASK